METASASCEVHIDGAQVACTRDELASGVPTILDNLTFGWGRTFLWEQPEPGTCSLQIHDQRTVPQPIEDIVHVGSQIDIWADSGAVPQPVEYMNYTFEDADRDPTTRMWLNDVWLYHQKPQQLARHNFYTDPSMTTLSGKSAGGGADLDIVTSWSMAGTTSIRIIPNAPNTASAVYPYSNTTSLNGYVAGNTYTISATCRLDQVMTGPFGAATRCILVHAVVGGSAVEIGRSDTAPNAVGEYRLDTTFTIPADATAFYFRLMNGSGEVNDWIWWDGLLITQGGVGSHRPWLYFDGDTSRPGYSYSWTGTANASASEERYLASPPLSQPIRITPPGQGGQGNYAANPNTSSSSWADWEIAPAEWDSSWPRYAPRAMRPGEVWTYSIMTHAPENARLALAFRGRRTSNVDVDPVSTPLIDGATVKVLYGTGGWVTTTGTITNTHTETVWPTWFITTYPEAYVSGSYLPAIDNLIITAPADPDTRTLVWAGRVTDVTVNPVEAGTVTIAITAASSVAELANVSVGDEPWPATDFITTRLRRVADLIPAPTNEKFTLSYDPTLANWEQNNLAGRDIDKQPVLGLFQDYASMSLGVAWPMYHSAARAHLWVEDLQNRITTAWTGPVGILSACNMERSEIQISQSSDRLINTVDVSWHYGDEQRTTTVTNDTSIDMYGPFRLKIDTEYQGAESGSTDAQTFGELTLDWASASSWGLSGVTFNTRDVDNTDGNAQALLDLLLNSTQRPGLRLTITDLAEYMPAELATGFVEGGTISYVGGYWEFDLNLTSGSPL